MEVPTWFSRLAFKIQFVSTTLHLVWDMFGNNYGSVAAASTTRLYFASAGKERESKLWDEFCVPTPSSEMFSLASCSEESCPNGENFIFPLRWNGFTECWSPCPSAGWRVIWLGIWWVHENVCYLSFLHEKSQRLVYSQQPAIQDKCNTSVLFLFDWRLQLNQIMRFL